MSMELNIDSLFQYLVTIMMITAVGYKFYSFREQKDIVKKLDDAEAKAFGKTEGMHIDNVGGYLLDFPELQSETFWSDLRKKGDKQLEQKIHEIQNKIHSIQVNIEKNKSILSIADLSKFYNRQIELYQNGTRSRATLSFLFAIISMLAGMAFLFGGGMYVLTHSQPTTVIPGTIISTIGATISAFIAKTFLDVHKLSLNQLNQYFKQPVINDHVLMAQRLAEALDDDVARKESYIKIISSVTGLIDGLGEKQNDTDKPTKGK